MHVSDYVLQIPNELFAPAESLHYEGDFALPVLKSGPDLYSFSKPLAYSIDITNTGEALLVTGMVQGAATTSCARCLVSTEYELVGDVEGYFIIDSQSLECEEFEEGDFDLLPEDHTIDLEPLFMAALLIDVPNMPLCKDDCKGLCATCGANLNEGDCACGNKEVDEADTYANSPFAVLKNLQLS